MAGERRVAGEGGSAVAALAGLERRVAGDFVLTALAVASELGAAHAAHVAESFVLDADVTTKSVVGGEFGAALLA